MSVQSIIEDLENIAASIVARSQMDFRKDPDSVGGNLMERGLDSLDFIDYLMAIEDKYGRVSEEDIEMHDLRSTANMAQFLYRHSKIKDAP